MRFGNIKRQARPFILTAGTVLAACSGENAPREQQHIAAKDVHRDSLGFANRVWKVQSSSTVALGTMYVFLSDGTLLITSDRSTPALGKWKREGGQMTMIEEGRPYKVAILQSSPDSFRITISNPGEPVEIGFVPATAGSLPR